MTNIFHEVSEDSDEQVTLKYGDFQFRLITEHSLWGHVLWNASKVLADLIKSCKINVSGKTTLELGAGAALPSL